MKGRLKRVGCRIGEDHYPGWFLLCLICGKVHRDYPYKTECQGTTYVHRLDEVVEWAEPGERVRRIRVEAFNTQTESEISGNHRITKPSGKTSPDSDTAKSPAKHSDVRERIDKEQLKDGIEVIWTEDLEGDQEEGFILPGRGRPTGEKP